MKIGSPCRVGDRYGEVVNFHKLGYTVREPSGRCFVAKKQDVKRTRRRYSKAGTLVWLRVKDVDAPVKAVAIGAGQFRGVDHPIWDGCEFKDKDAKVISGVEIGT